MSENIFRTLVKLRPVRTPQMASKVDFTACFYHSMTDAAFELLTSLTTKRAAIVAFMKPGAAAMSAADQLVLVDTYLVDVWNLVNSLNGQPPVKLDRQLQFDWICYLYTSKKEMNATSTGISFELMMTMHLKACLHHHIAKLMIDSDFRNVAEASKHLCIATGVMNCLEVSLVGTVPEMLNKPSEIKVEYCAFLRKYYMSCAQQMFAAKAIQSGNTLSAKVSLAVSDMLTDMMATIPPTGLEGLFDHLGFLRCFFAGIGYKLRAEALAAKNETGQAIACTIFAASVLFEQQSKPYNPLHPGLPKLKHIEEPFASGVRDLLAEIKTVRDSATKDNNLIYFHVAPNSVSELAEPFLGMVAVKAQLYSPPQQTSIIQFLYDASRRPSTFSKLAGSFMSAISASFGLGETAESAAAADRKQGELAESAPPALFPSGPNSVVSVTATHTAVLSYLPPSAEGASAQTVAVGAVLQPPHAAITRSDSDFARELDCQLNGLPPNP